MKRIVYPGTFDPITLGHANIARRAAALFDEVIVAVGNNPAKTPLFNQAERAEMVASEISDIKNISVDTFEGLLVDYMRDKGLHLVLRGLRTPTDLEYELQMFATNKSVIPELEVVFLAAANEYAFYNSRLLREIATGGHAPDNIISAKVASKLIAKTKN